MASHAAISVFRERPAAPTSTLPLPHRQPANEEAVNIGPVLLEWLRTGIWSLRPAPDECLLPLQATRGALGSIPGQPMGLDGGHGLVTAGDPVQLRNSPTGTTLCLRFPLDRLSRRVIGRVQSRPVAPLLIEGAAGMCLELGRWGQTQPETQDRLPR